MSTLTYQPEAERYYADGYWRPGDLWGDFAARAQASPHKVALLLDDRRITYRDLRRAAVALSSRLAASVQPGDVVLLLGRHSIEAAVALLGCLHRGAVLAPLPPMFNVRSSRPSPVRRGRRRSSASAARGRSPSASRRRRSSSSS